MSENVTAVSVPAADTKPQNDVKTDDGKVKVLFYHFTFIKINV